MVQLTILQPHVVLWYKSKHYTTDSTIQLSVKADAPLLELLKPLGLAGLEQPQKLQPRLVCHGVQLDLSQSLEQQNCQITDTIYLLDPLPNNSCLQWARRGRCPMGSRCRKASSHSMALSPRYVEHTRSTSVSPSASPPDTPERCASPSLHALPLLEKLDHTATVDVRTVLKKQKSGQRTQRREEEIAVDSLLQRQDDAGYWTENEFSTNAVHDQSEPQNGGTGWELWVSSGLWAWTNQNKRTRHLEECPSICLPNKPQQQQQEFTQLRYQWPDAVINARAAILVC